MSNELERFESLVKGVNNEMLHSEQLKQQNDWINSELSKNLK